MSWTVWITGVPGSGKSAVARAAAAAISAAGHAVALLELDEMRRVVTPRPTFSDVEHDLVHRALVYVASAVVDVGVPVIIDATGHRRAWRDLARMLLPQFAEIQLRGAPDAAYEPAASPELEIDPTRETPASAGARIAELVKAWPQTPARAVSQQWAMWITGLPGSGKTTLASGVAEALIQRGVDVRILDLTELRAFVTAGQWSPLAEDIAHRALVYTAKRLTEVGMPVIVDATAPLRAWRQLARQRIPRFAEVQLVCPAAVCAHRERAVRWRLVGCPHRRMTEPPAGGPDVVLSYEHALSPELMIHTDVEDPWSATQAMIALTLRLQRRDSVQVA